MLIQKRKRKLEYQSNISNDSWTKTDCPCRTLFWTIYQYEHLYNTMPPLDKQRQGNVHSQFPVSYLPVFPVSECGGRDRKSKSLTLQSLNQGTPFASSIRYPILSVCVYKWSTIEQFLRRTLCVFLDILILCHFRHSIPERKDPQHLRIKWRQISAQCSSVRCHLYFTQIHKTLFNKISTYWSYIPPLSNQATKWSMGYLIVLHSRDEFAKTNWPVRSCISCLSVVSKSSRQSAVSVKLRAPIGVRSFTETADCMDDFETSLSGVTPEKVRLTIACCREAPRSCTETAEVCNWNSLCMRTTTLGGVIYQNPDISKRRFF